MKSHILSLSFLFLACLGMTACSEHNWADEGQTQCMELTVSCANVGIARADGTRPGELDYNENLIQTLHYFLYPKGQTDANAVIVGKMDIVDGRQGNVKIRVPLNETELNTVLFPRPIMDCEVYLIANLPDGLIADNSNTSLDALKDLVIETDFKTNATQASFIMDGQCTATITNRNQTVAAKGTIELKRLAAKFTTRISVDPTFTDTDGKEYTPQVQAMQIHLDNAGGNTTLSGTFATELFDFNKRQRIGTQTENTDTYSIFAPFYSYPREWDYDDNALVMYITLPWVYQQNGETITQNCYYKVYPGTMQLERNHWYNLDLNIGVLGSFSDTEERVELTDFEYKVVDWKNGYADWQSGVNLETEILSAYYLVVEQNKYEVNNKNTFEIPFISSHECIIKDLTMTYVYFGTSDTSEPEDKPVTITTDTQGTHYKIGNKDTDWVKLEGNTIKLSHTLNNDFVNTTDYDYSPFTISFTLCHKNNQTKYSERITIIQKPAISITAHLNSYREAYLNEELPNNNDGKNGYQYVNGTAAADGGNGGKYGGAHGLTGGNTNPYMYIIEVSVLPAGSQYILGDPRFDTPATSENKQNLDFNNFVNAPGIEGTNSRKLQNYYGTKTDASVQNMIAPKFRIASSHGVTSTVSHQDAMNRAASYQEDGYPAGRWRVPTAAEVQFMIKLSSDKKIPTLFTAGNAYWCANGKVTPISGGGFTYNPGTTGNNGPVRCVYDDWYWENSQWPRMASRGDHPYKYNQFTWGDEIN